MYLIPWCKDWGECPKGDKTMNKTVAHTGVWDGLGQVGSQWVYDGFILVDGLCIDLFKDQYGNVYEDAV